MINKTSKGYLTVEATISLTVFWFMMMFIMNMGQIYRAQNYVAHGLLQTGKALSFASFDYNHYSVSESVVDTVGRMLGFNIGHDLELYNNWRNARYDKAVEKAFASCADVDYGKTNETLKRYGMKDGIGSIKFTAKVDSGDLDIKAEYRVERPFAFFGFDHINMHQEVKCGLWK